MLLLGQSLIVVGVLKINDLLEFARFVGLERETLFSLDQPFTHATLQGQDNCQKLYLVCFVLNRFLG